MSIRTSESEFFPKIPELPTLLTGLCNEQKALSHKTASFAVHDQVKGTRRQQKAGNNKPLAPLPEQHKLSHPRDNTSVTSLEQHFKLMEQSQMSWEATVMAMAARERDTITSNRHLQVRDFFDVEAVDVQKDRAIDEVCVMTDAKDGSKFDSQDSDASTAYASKKFDSQDSDDSTAYASSGSVEEASNDDSSPSLMGSESVGMDESLMAVSEKMEVLMDEQWKRWHELAKDGYGQGRHESITPASNGRLEMEGSMVVATADDHHSAEPSLIPLCRALKAGIALRKKYGKSVVPISSGSIGMDESAAKHDNSATPIISGSIGMDESVVKPDDSAAPISSGSIGMDESSAARTFQSQVSELRAPQKSSTRRENFLRGKTVEVRSQVGTFDGTRCMIIPEGALQDLTSTCAQHDEDVMEPTASVALRPKKGTQIALRTTRPRKIVRGKTVAVGGKVDTKCIPEEQLESMMSTFTRYDEDGNGRLSVLEFGQFLQDQGMTVEDLDVKEVVEMVAPEGQASVDFASFKQLVAHGLQADALREEQYCGYSKEDADVLRGVFDAYDVNHSGVLDAPELGNLLQDMGQAPNSFSEQEKLRAVLERIVGGSLRPLRFREFLELAKILEKTTIGSGGQRHEEQSRRSSDFMEVARKVGLTMADVTRLQEIFATDAKHGTTITSTELYALLKSRLQLRHKEGEREQHVHSKIEKYTEGKADAFQFDDFLIIVGDLINANLATVPSLLGEEATSRFRGHMAAILK